MLLPRHKEAVSLRGQYDYNVRLLMKEWWYLKSELSPRNLQILKDRLQRNLMI